MLTKIQILLTPTEHKDAMRNSHPSIASAPWLESHGIESFSDKEKEHIAVIEAVIKIQRVRIYRVVLCDTVEC